MDLNGISRELMACVDALRQSVVLLQREVGDLRDAARSIALSDAARWRDAVSRNVEAEAAEAGGLFVDEEAHVASVRGEELQLTKNEFAALAFLFTRRLRAVRFEELTLAVWGDDGDAFARRNDVHHLVHRVKRKLEPYGLKESIQNLRDVGYRYRPTEPH